MLVLMKQGILVNTWEYGIYTLDLNLLGICVLRMCMYVVRSIL